MSWLTLIWALQLGYMPLQQVMVGPCMWQSPQGATEATMESAIVLFDHIELGGSLHSYQTPMSNGSFMPYRIDYGIHADIVFKTETSALKFGISHECDHSITLGEFPSPPVPLAMASTEVYIRFEQKVQF
jgi:hypothetical protein